MEASLPGLITSLSEGYLSGLQRGEQITPPFPTYHIPNPGLSAPAFI